MDEVFRQQPAAVQNFLLQTSILERFTAPLCDALRAGDEERPATDSRAILRAVDQANLFLIPLDTSREWYRYHHLFADLLRHRLELDGRYDVAGLHQRASRWYLEHGYTAEAIDHALATANWPYAAGLVAVHYDSLLKQGEVATALRWFQALPEEVILAQRTRDGHADFLTARKAKDELKDGLFVSKDQMNIPITRA